MKPGDADGSARHPPTRERRRRELRYVVRMRILVVSNLFPPVVRGGYEVECSGVVERLGRRHEVTVLTSTLENPGEQPGVRRELTFLDENWKGTARAPIASLRAARVTRNALKELRPDFVFVWNGSQIPQACLRVIADSGIPTAYRVCEHWFGRMFENDQYLRYLVPGHSGTDLLWAAGARLLNRAPGLRLDPLRRSRAAVSWNSEAIRRLGGVPTAVDVQFEQTIHSTSINGPRFEAITRAPSPEPTILFIGRLWKGKGAWVVVRALGRLRAEHGITARLTLAGPEEPGERTAILREIEHAGVRDLVDLVGPLPPERVADLLATTHVLVVPSTWVEPFPLVCIEGALARVPLVASDIGGIPEFLTDDEHGLLFPPGDSDACAEALRFTLTDADATDGRVRRALTRAQTLGWESYLDASERFVDEAYAALTERDTKPSRILPLRVR